MHSTLRGDIHDIPSDYGAIEELQKYTDIALRSQPKIEYNFLTKTFYCYWLEPIIKDGKLIFDKVRKIELKIVH
mgnify:CR=1 FL=1